MTAQTTDLNEPYAPSLIPGVLRRAADKMREQQAELAASWGDKNAGKDWLVVAKELDAAAKRIESKLG